MKGKYEKQMPTYSVPQQIAIATCLFVSLIAIIILVFVVVTMRDIMQTDNKNEVVAVVEEAPTTVKVEEAEYLPGVYLLGNISKLEYPEEESVENTLPIEEEVQSTESNVPEYVEFEKVACDVAEEDMKKQMEEESPAPLPIIENLQDNLSKWCKTNDSDDPVTIWKVTDRRGSLLISLRDEEGKTLSTFRFEGIESYYEDWVKCDRFFDEITVSDLRDYSFTPYHEVGGSNAKNVQLQVAVLINRQIDDGYPIYEGYPNTVRGIIQDGGGSQYSSAYCITNRILKGDGNFLERQDLEQCFRQALLYLAGEGIEVPVDVIYAAPWKQGSGCFDEVNGTYYCHK